MIRAINKAQPYHLKKILGIAFGLAVVTGSTIGVGILRTPASIAAMLPNAALIMACWIAIGLYIMLAASSYAELTTMMPKAGGAYNYIRRAFGNNAGFINGWFDFMSNAIAPAYFCIVLGEYTALVFPALQEHQKLIAIGFLTAFTALNLPGIRSGSIVQKVTSAIKILLFAGLIAGCFIKGSPASSPKVSQMLTGGIVIAIFKSLQLIMGTYDGWMSVSFFAEEDENPSRNVPRSYLTGAAAIAVLYVLINAAILYVLPVDDIAKSPLAAADAASVVFGSSAAGLMTAVAIFSLMSILNAYMLIPSRILYGLSRDRFFISQGTLVNRGGTPYFSLLVCFAIAFGLILVSSFGQLFGLATLMMTVVTGFAFASLIRLRYTAPEMDRPYRAFGYPFTTWLTLLVTVALFVGFALGDRVSFWIVLSLTFFLMMWRAAIRRT